MLENNDALRENLQYKQMPTREFVNFTINGGYSEKKIIFWRAVYMMRLTFCMYLVSFIKELSS